MDEINIDNVDFFVADYKSNQTKKAGIILSDKLGDVQIKSNSKYNINKIIAALERAKIELDRMKSKCIVESNIPVKYHKVLSK